MTINTERTTGRSQNYKFDRGGVPTDFGPFSGEVMNNVDATRSGRLQVYIDQFGTGNKNDQSKWRTVSYCSPFAGATPKTSTSTGSGTYGSNNNQQSYGMWATVPDVGVTVLCFFIGGDPKQGYYTGFLPGQGINQMTPAIGATTNAAKQNADQNSYFAQSTQLPATEINNALENTQITENPQFFNQPKPVHSYVASALFQQGTVNDPIRGTITSSAQRESPSSVTGLSSPGRPIYTGGLQDATIKQQISAGTVQSTQTQVAGRRGGHSIVLDDGDLSGNNQLIRIRTSLGHQITMSDDGRSIYIAHANGQAWVEFGQEGTLDIYTTNSVNVRTEGTLNLHADQDININAGGNLNMLSNLATTLQSNQNFGIISKQDLNMYGQAMIGINAGGTLGLKSGSGGWTADGELAFDGSTIDLNSGTSSSETSFIQTPKGLTTYTMPDASFNTSTGWQVAATKLNSVVTRAPTHEPWPYHNQGTKVDVNLSDGTNSTSPSAPAIPPGFAITQTGNSVTLAAQALATAKSAVAFNQGSTTQ